VSADRECRICGCTDEDCSDCITRTGRPCSWAEPDLCTACVPLRLTPDMVEVVEECIEKAFPAGAKLSATTCERHGFIRIEDALNKRSLLTLDESKPADHALALLFVRTPDFLSALIDEVRALWAEREARP
jgi:hypothetical protein